MTSFFLGRKTSASFLSTFCGSSQSGRIDTFYAVRSGSTRALSISAELKESRPKALPFGSRIFISLLQYAELNGMWIPVSFDAIATVRLLGQYSLAGLNIRAPDQLSAAPKHEP
jgi:hypothetical protein